jgi:hypothetical protein
VAEQELLSLSVLKEANGQMDHLGTYLTIFLKKIFSSPRSSPRAGPRAGPKNYSILINSDLIICLDEDILSIQSSSLLLYKSFLSVVNPDNIGIIESKSITVDLSLEEDDKSYMSDSLRFPTRGRQSTSNSASQASTQVSSLMSTSTPKTPVALVQTTLTKSITENGRVKASFTGPTGLRPIFGAESILPNTNLRNKRQVETAPSGDSDDDDARLCDDLLSEETLKKRNAMQANLAKSSGKNASSDNSGAAAAASSPRGATAPTIMGADGKSIQLQYRQIDSGNEASYFAYDDDKDSDNESDDIIAFERYDPDNKNPIVSSSLAKGIKPSK